MPYTSNKELPAYVRKRSAKKQRQWRHVWMSIHERTGDEGRAFAGANAAVKKSFDAPILLRRDRN